MIARRIRAAVILIALWGFASGVLVTAFGVIVALIRGVGYENNLQALLLQSFIIGAEFGMVIGAGFSALLAIRGEQAERGRFNLLREILGGAILGAVLGTAALLLIRLSEGVALSQLLLWPQMLPPMLILGGVGAIVGPGILAIARRGKALPSEHDSGPLAPGRTETAYLGRSKP